MFSTFDVSDHVQSRGICVRKNEASKRAMFSYIDSHGYRMFEVVDYSTNEHGSHVMSSSCKVDARNYMA
jgi:hypothetical protein